MMNRHRMAASPYTRRAFLKTMSVGAATLALPGCEPSSKQATPLPEQASPLPQIGLQLWTVREAIEQDMAGTLPLTIRVPRHLLNLVAFKACLDEAVRVLTAIAHQP